jgi:CheY-like chemotaxis protein
MNKQNYRILIVDDNNSVLLLLRRIIEGEGYTVKSAVHGQEALSVAEKLKPHMIITDLKMPVMDGLALMRTRLYLKAP